MRIGYACVTVGPEDTQMKTCRQSNADEALLTELIGHNLDALDRQIEYNIRNRIRLFRISSDLIPFGSSPVNRIPWRKLFEKRLLLTGEKIQKHALRVSMHPGQYTVLNSPDRDVVERAVKDLAYHCNVLDTMNLNKQHKIILHVGACTEIRRKPQTGFWIIAGACLRRFWIGWFWKTTTAPITRETCCPSLAKRACLLCMIICTTG